MLKGKIVLSGCLIVAIILLQTFAAFAEDMGIGEYVRKAAPKGPAAAIPRGHYGLIAKYADAFLSNPPGPSRTIYAATLMDGIDVSDMADELDDFFLLDIRKPEDFCKGYISGAINIPFEKVAKPENLAMLPTDMPILVICYTGHTASQINSILNMLGYNAWTLRFGMTSWRDVSSTRVWSSGVTQDIHGAGYLQEICP
jgi:rhodanese-related sulfurtransferase